MPELTYGNMSPELTIQLGDLDCLAPCFYEMMNPEIQEHLGFQDKEDGLQKICEILGEAAILHDGGSPLASGAKLNIALRKLGLEASVLYEPRSMNANFPEKVEERIHLISEVLQRNNTVLIAYPRYRANPGEDPFLHYSNITGYSEIDGVSTVAIMDPSRVDGQLRYPINEDFLKYVTPDHYLPVMGWEVRTLTLKEFIAKQNSDDLPVIQELDLSKAHGVELLLTDPTCLELDTGKPVPDVPHAIGVGICSYEDTVQFLTNKEVFLARGSGWELGYPRFVVDPFVRELAVKLMGNADWLPFTTEHDALVSAYMANTKRGSANGMGIEIVEHEGLFWLSEKDNDGYARSGWQHLGLGLTSRQALAILQGNPINDLEARGLAEQELKMRIAMHKPGLDLDDIYLFPTGMAAIHTINEILKEITPDAPSVQYGPPYVDTYEVQAQFGPSLDIKTNVVDIRNQSMDVLEYVLATTNQKVRSIFIEIPGNPLLNVAPIEQIARLARGRAPVVYDETIASMFNTDWDKLSILDVCVGSGTKLLSPYGNVNNGYICLNPKSRYYERIKAKLEERYVDTLWHEDIAVMAANSREFDQIMPAINGKALEIAQWLQAEHVGSSRLLSRVYHPAISDKANYDSIRSANGGYGPLVSFEFNEHDRAKEFFRLLRVSKTPGLGMKASSACFQTLLAQSGDLPAARKVGVNKRLIRLSAGIEPDLKARFEEALYGAENNVYYGNPNFDDPDTMVE